MRSVILLLLAVVVLNITPSLLADDRASQDIIAKGTRATAFTLAKDEKLGEGIRPGVMVDVIAEISEPIKTGVALENVKLLAINVNGVGDQRLTVQVTPTQAKVLALLQEDRARLRAKLHDVKK